VTIDTTANFDKGKKETGNGLELHTLFMTSSSKIHTLFSGSSPYSQYRKGKGRSSVFNGQSQINFLILENGTDITHAMHVANYT